MNQTLIDQVIEAPNTGEFHYRYRLYAPGIPARALVVYLPQYGGTLDAQDLADWIEQRGR